jgi:hypothetical protein
MLLSLTFYHNAFSFIYCNIIIPIVCYSLIYANYETYYCIYGLSMVYFPISIILNYYENIPLFIVHHIIVILSLQLPYLCNDYDLYVEIIYYALLSEISTIILTLKIMIKEFDEKIYEKIKHYIDLLFATTFILIRIVYLSSVMYDFLFQLDYKYDKYCTLCSYLFIVLMMSMNYYWTINIIFKCFHEIKKLFMKKNK